MSVGKPDAAFAQNLDHRIHQVHAGAGQFHVAAGDGGGHGIGAGLDTVGHHRVFGAV
jgi:hypothetical protein